MGWPQCFFFCRIITHGDNMHIVSTYCMLYIPIETRRGAHYTHGGLSIETRRGTSLQKKTRMCSSFFCYGRRGKNRTLTDGFGDHCSTIKLLS